MMETNQFFDNCALKIIELSLKQIDHNRNVLIQLLDELNGLQYRYLVISKTKAILLINQCCTLIGVEDTELVVKCCVLIANLVNQQHVVVESRTLINTVLWCLQSLKIPECATEKLWALDALLRSKHNNQNLIPLVINDNSPIMLFLRNSTVHSYPAVCCLEACTNSPENSGNFHEKYATEFRIILEIFIKFLCDDNHSDQLTFINLATKCLQGIQNIITNNPELLNDNLGIILGIIKTYMLYNIPDIPFTKPQKLIPTALNQPETTGNGIKDRKGGKILKLRKQRPQNSLNKIWIPDSNPHLNLPPLQTSDSEFSDTESGKLSKISIKSGRIRQISLTIFQTIIQTVDKTILYSFWTNFLQENIHSNQHNLTNCIIKDPSIRARMHAINALIALINRSKSYLMQAEMIQQSTAFTSHSTIVALIIESVHNCLLMTLNQQQTTPIIVQLLKCLSALIQSTPYHRLKTGLITKIINKTRTYIYSKDHIIQVAGLIVFNCILTSEPIIPETNDGFNGEKSWIIMKCLINLGLNPDNNEWIPSEMSIPIKLESLQLISAANRHYFHQLIQPNLQPIGIVLNRLLLDKCVDVRLHAGRTIDTIGQAMDVYLTNHDEFVGESLDFWMNLMDGNLVKLLDDPDNPAIRAVGCDCLGSIGGIVFERFNREKQIICITLLFGCTHDVENGPRSSAIRALALCVLYHSLREDLTFVVDTVEAICAAIQTGNLMLKIKSAWSLGNLSDALVLNRFDPNINEELPIDLLIKLFNITLKSFVDNDKIKMNLVRCLGNLLQLLDENVLDDERFVGFITDSFRVLVQNTRQGYNAKVKWNACYAIGNALKNVQIYKFGVNWQNDVYNLLMDLVKSYKNFKVRINAALALSCPESREFYGDFFIQIWIALLCGLENTQDMNDFNEYKHRDNLIEQICLTLSHLTIILQRNDLLKFYEDVIPFLDSMKIHMQRVVEKLIPEKSTIIFDAHSHLKQLKSDDLNFEERSVLNALQDVFVDVI